MNEQSEPKDLLSALAAASKVTVVSGTPDDSEVAALVAGLAAVATVSTDDDSDAVASSEWTNRSRLLRGNAAAIPSQNAWRWSLRS